MFHAYFFKKHWDLCGHEVTNAVMRILHVEDIPEGINKNFIVLIPKVVNPKELGQFVPLVSAMLPTKLHLKFR